MKEWVKARNKIIKNENLIITKPNGKSQQLIKASKICNDEFYTKWETAKQMIDPFLKYLKGKRIICPCDTEESQIFKYLKFKKLNVSCCMSFNIDYSNYDVVITNHPWSKTKKFFEAISGKKYLIIGNAIAPTSSHFKKWGKYWSKAFSTDWVNTSKKVNCRFYSNIKNVWKKEKGEHVKDGYLYTVSCLDKTSRLDFVLCNILKNDRLSFKRFAFGNVIHIKYTHIANTGSFRRDYKESENGSVNVIKHYANYEGLLS